MSKENFKLNDMMNMLGNTSFVKDSVAEVTGRLMLFLEYLLSMIEEEQEDFFI